MTDRLQNIESLEISTTVQVANWLRSREKPFMDQLQLIAERMDTGFQEVISTIGYEDYYPENKIFKLWKRPVDAEKGKFTGAGLCAIAVGAMENALIQKFGDNIEIESIFIATEHKDMDEGYKVPKYEMGHHILRFKMKNDNIWYTADPTYRQFQEKIKIGRILITPSDNENRLYSYERSYKQMLDLGREDAWKYKPQKYPRGKLFERYMMRIEERDVKGLTKTDYQNLSESLLK